MLSYEVNLRISSDIYDEYVQWLTPHIKKMLTFKGFLQAELHEEKENNTDPNVRQLTAIYHVDTQENLQNYFSSMAQTMREDGIKRFGNKFTAQRRILKLKEKFTKNLVS